MMPKFYDNLDKQFELFLESIERSIELCGSVKHCKMKKRKSHWCSKKV